ncbi:MAG: hypothetical protein B7Y56_04485 [Gallionellales bacterium 35-53-114]|jgi:Tfp pilus assembly protein PilX|nr:MAG: hypothetical protein B7Y56_04485 [Gallionellales bacterium 35-53-114]OYZ65349.1 MAG: hypothetical protein B7Y04_01640 [Gallionellales bacterium 24-53-125]OZB08256.1 MAG: hypothetical protein B7X61_12095 [Gallionellales bacterium 39-52-133]HQS58188.1 hypothetical protein [Gallionellaceae bacterium]HQS73743.1 hypothetical protein [Gallionellaceae bacterium]
MKTLNLSRFKQTRIKQQRGLVLFFALIALVVMSLAAVALIRSVDTSTMIAGNMAFKQAATSSSDAGIEAAGNWLLGIQAANPGVSALLVTAHPFNSTNLATNPGYHSNVVLDPLLPGFIDLTSDAIWNNTNSAAVNGGLPDATGNTIRYIIQRMCRVANTRAADADCLFSIQLDGGMDQGIPPQPGCNDGPNCPTEDQSPQIRVTVRTTGPKNTVSYTQAFLY